MFAHPFLLFGSALGIAPILIHLLNRRRFRIIRWAAMKFLFESQRKNYRRIRLEHLLLLLVRTLILVLLPVALAQPRIARDSLAALMATSGSRHVFLFLDNSFSMGYQTGSRTLLDQAKSTAKSLLETLKEGDKVSFYLVADVPTGVIKEPSYNLKTVSAELESVTLSHGSTDIPAALIEAARIVRESSTSSQREVYLLTDLQQAGWKLEGAGKDPEFHKELNELSKRSDVFLIDLGKNDAMNAAVTEIKTSQKMVLAGEMTSFEATVCNFGKQEIPKIVAHFSVDNRKQGSSALRIPAREKATVRFNYVFRDREPHIVSLRLDPDDLPLDDFHYAVLDPVDSVRILCVDGMPGGGPGEGETRYLKVALAPTGSQSPLSPEIATPFSLKPSSFLDYQVIILANVGLVTPETVDALEHYVREGGALLVFPGDRVDTRFYNEKLFREGQGLLPGLLDGVVEKQEDPLGPCFFDPRSPGHPILAMFQGLQTTPLSSVLVSKYFRVLLPQESPDTTVACRYNSGDPAILEKKFGLGRVMLYTTTADADWTNLPQKPVFLPMLHESIFFLIQGKNPRKNLAVGESYRRFLKPQEYSGRFSIRRAPEFLGAARTEPDRDEKSVLLAGIQTQEQFILEFGDARSAGVYRVERSDVAGSLDLFCVNVPPEEGDLQKISVEQLRKAFPGFQFQYTTGESGFKPAAETRQSPLELWKTLLGIVLVLVCLESFLAHRFGK